MNYLRNLTAILTTITLTACTQHTNPPAPQPTTAGTHVIIDGTLTPKHYALTFQQNETEQNDITITRTTAPLHQHPLQPTDTLLITQPTTRPPQETIRVIQQHATQGGHVILLANAHATPNTDHINDIANALGIHFNDDIITDTTNNHHTLHHPNTTRITQHQHNVTTVTLMQARTITGGTPWLLTENTAERTTITNQTTNEHTPERTTITNQDTTSENPNNQTHLHPHNTNNPTGTHTIGTTTRYGQGTITAIGDANLITPWINHATQTTYGLYTNDNCQLILNILTHTNPNTNPTCQAPQITPDTHEPNNQPTNPTPLTPQPQQTTTATITQNDTDHYSIHTTKTHHISVTLDTCVNNYCTFAPITATITHDTHDTTNHTHNKTTTSTTPPGITTIRITAEQPTKYLLHITLTPAGNGTIEGTAYGHNQTQPAPTQEPHTPNSLPQELGLQPDAEIIPNQLIIRRTNEQGIISLPELITLDHQPTTQNTRDTITVNDARATTTLQALRSLRGAPGVHDVTLNYVMRTALTNPHTPTEARSVTNASNDPLVHQQWHYDTIHLADAWEHAGSHPVTVAVIDTGVSSNRDLTCGTVPGYDILDRDDNPRDEGTWDTNKHHGTHVAGTIAACTNNRQGVAGVTGQAPIRIQHIRVLDQHGNGNMHDVTLAIAWAAGLDTTEAGIPTNPNPADVINLSLGCYACDNPILENIVLQATQRGTIIITAAGNNAADAKRFLPGAYPTTINVAANNHTNQLSDYSNHGATTDILAPGGDHQAGVLSTTGDHQYRTLIGTSMAAPHVTGVTALLLTRNPNLTWLQVRDTLQRTSTPPQQCPTTRCPHGILNAHAALTTAPTEQTNEWITITDTTTLREHTTGTITIWNAGSRTETITAYHGRGTLTPSTTTLTLRPNETGIITVTPHVPNHPEGIHTATLHLYTSTQRHQITYTIIKGHGIKHADAYVLITSEHDPLTPILMTPVTHDDGYRFTINQLPAGTYGISGITNQNCHLVPVPRIITIHENTTTQVNDLPIHAPCRP